MSTRCTINFVENGDVFAKVYRHHDGYPDGKHGVLASLKQFFEEVRQQTSDTRFNDPSYLAAKFVVWQSRQHCDVQNPLAFLGVGVVQNDPVDIDYSYFVDCGEMSPDGTPRVSYKEAE